MRSVSASWALQRAVVACAPHSGRLESLLLGAERRLRVVQPLLGLGDHLLSRGDRLELILKLLERLGVFRLRGTRGARSLSMENRASPVAAPPALPRVAARYISKQPLQP